MWQELAHSCLSGLAGLLTVPAVLLLIAAILLTHARFTWLNPDFLKQIPIRHKIYEQLPGLILDGLLEEAALSAADPDLITEFEQTLGRENLEALVAAFMPPDWVQQQVEQNIEALFAFLDGETPYPYLEIQTSDLRARATSREVRDALVNLLAPLPPCEQDYNFWRSDIPQCRPSEALLDEMLADAALSLEEMYPADFSYHEIVENEFNYYDRPLTEFEQVQWGYRIFNWGLWGLWLIYLVLMGFITLIFARDLGSALLWVGWPTLVGSGIALVRFILVLGLVPLLANYWITQLPPDAPRGLATNLGAILTACNFDFQGVGLLLSGTLAFLSALAIAVSVLLRRLQGDSSDNTSEHWV
jgi:hypothetical protein